MMTILRSKNAVVVKAVYVDGLCQREAAKLAGVSQGQVCKILEQFSTELGVIIGSGWSPWWKRDVISVLLGRAAVIRAGGKLPEPKNRLVAPIAGREPRGAAGGGVAKKRGRPRKTTPPDP